MLKHPYVLNDTHRQLDGSDREQHQEIRTEVERFDRSMLIICPVSPIEAERESRINSLVINASLMYYPSIPSTLLSLIHILGLYLECCLKMTNIIN